MNNRIKKITISTVERASNVTIEYPQEAKTIINEARAEAKAMLKKFDYDYILIIIYFLTKGVKGLKIRLKNDYARQLKNEIKTLLKA